MAGNSHSWNVAGPMVAANVPVLAWPPSVKPQRHVLTQLFVARSAHPKTEGANSPTEQSVTLFYYLILTIGYHSANGTGSQWF